MLAVTPVSWAHHWVWLMLPLAALVASLPSSGRERSGRVLLVVAVAGALARASPRSRRRLDLTGAGRVLLGEWIGDAYLLIGFALLAWFALLALRPRPGTELSVGTDALASDSADKSE